MGVRCEEMGQPVPEPAQASVPALMNVPVPMAVLPRVFPPVLMPMPLLKPVPVPVVVSVVLGAHMLPFPGSRCARWTRPTRPAIMCV